MPTLGDTKLQKLTPGQLDRLYRKLERSGGVNGKPLSPRTVRYLHTIIRKMLAQAVRDSLLATNPADRADPPSAREAKAPEMVTGSGEQMGRFLSKATDHALYPLFVVYATTGLRRGEGLGLLWQDVDLEKGRLSVRRSVTETAGVVRIEATKTDRSRVVDLDDFTVSVLRAHKVAQAAQRLRLGDLWQDEGRVFAHDGRNIRGRQAGGVLQPESVLRSFKALLGRINAKLEAHEKLPDMHLHGLRHTWATLALSHGVHFKVVQERLGHSTPQITLSVYSHVGDTLQRDAAATVASAILGS